MRNCLCIVFIRAIAQIIFPSDVECLHLPIEDSPTANLLSIVPASIEFIKTSPGPVLVHCYAGISRSASVVAAWLVTQFDVSLEHALDTISSVRPLIQPNEGFLAALASLASLASLAALESGGPGGSQDARTQI